jgi:hypothetical protein
MVHGIAQGEPQNGEIFRREFHGAFLAASDDAVNDDAVKAHFFRSSFGPALDASCCWLCEDLFNQFVQIRHLQRKKKTPRDMNSRRLRWYARCQTTEKLSIMTGELPDAE